MSATDLNRVLNAPGRLCYGPTDLSVAFPHGGTAIGSVHKAGVTRVDTRREIKDEAFGQEVKEVVWCGENWALACILREFDNDAIALLFNNTSTGTITQHKVVASPGSNRPGQALSERGVVLLFSPLDPDRVPAALFYKAVPLTEETLRMEKALNKRLEVGAVFLGLRDGSNRIVKWGFLKDLSL